MNTSGVVRIHVLKGLPIDIPIDFVKQEIITHGVVDVTRMRSTTSRNELPFLFVSIVNTPDNKLNFVGIDYTDEFERIQAVLSLPTF